MEQSGALAMHLHVDVMIYLKHQHLPVRDAVELVAKVVHDERHHLVELGC